MITFLALLFQVHSIVAFSETGWTARPRHIYSTYRAKKATPRLFSSPPDTQNESFTKQHLGAPICEYHQLTIPTTQEGPPRQSISVENLTPNIQSLLAKSQMKNGLLTVISRHTTTGITINERESRLAKDMSDYFLSLAPPDERSDAGTIKGVRYSHNDLDRRPESAEEKQRCLENGWNIHNPERLQAWRDQEPINAHSHLLSMLLGNSESIPVMNGEMVIGQWQSVLMVDFDGPRERTVGVQLTGYL